MSWNGYAQRDPPVHMLMESAQEKATLLEDPAMNDAEAGRGVILQFAMRIFLAADNEDRAGQATK